MKKWITVIVLAISLILTGCANDSTKTQGSEEATFQSVNIDEAKNLIENGITIVDVRTPEEYQAGHIPNSILIPLHEIEQRFSEFDAAGEYLIVCRSGNRSSQASELLVNAGIKNVYNMNGGMNAWDGQVE